MTRGQGLGFGRRRSRAPYGCGLHREWGFELLGPCYPERNCHAIVVKNLLDICFWILNAPDGSGGFQLQRPPPGKHDIASCLAPIEETPLGWERQHHQIQVKASRDSPSQKEIRIPPSPFLGAILGRRLKAPLAVCASHHHRSCAYFMASLNDVHQRVLKIHAHMSPV